MALDVRLQGVACALEELAQMRGPAILHLTEPDHFVVLVNQGGTQPQIVDSARITSDPARTSAFLGRFSGKALVLDQAGADEGPCLHIDAPVVANEPAPHGEPALARFEIENRGTESLDGIGVSAGCGLSVACDAETLAPGERATIIARHAQPSMGRYSYLVRLESSDPRRRMAYLSLTGSSVPEGVIVGPGSIAVTTRPTARTTVRQFWVTAPSGLDLAARTDWTEWVEAALVKAKDDGVAATWQGTVRVLSSAAPGRFEGEIRIVDAATDEPHAAIALKVGVLADLRSSPSRVFLGFLKRGGASAPRSLALATRSGTPMVVEKVEVSSDLIRCVEAPGGGYDISVSTDRLGPISGTIRITARGERTETLEVPVYGHVVE